MGYKANSEMGNYRKHLVHFGVFWMSLLICVNLLAAMNEFQENQIKEVRDVPAEAWDRLRSKKIFFGHQSVGENIVDGIKRFGQEFPQAKLRVLLFDGISSLNGPGFYHAPIGRNHEPLSKVDHFVNIIKQVPNQGFDLAFFKFCFVDINASVQVGTLFEYYSKNMEWLRKHYPKTCFIHITVPLLKRPESSIFQRLKIILKKVTLRKEDNFFDDAHNIARHDFNELLRKWCREKKEPLFDLAQVESTFPDGKRCSFEKDGKIFYSLVPRYTDDGGHLNEFGKRIVAEKLLIYLSSLQN